MRKERPRDLTAGFPASQGAQSAQQRTLSSSSGVSAHTPQENTQATCSRNLGGKTVTSAAVLVSVGEKAAYCKSSSHITTLTQMTAYTLFQQPRITSAVQSALFADQVDVSVGQARNSRVFRMEVMPSINLMGVCHGHSSTTVQAGLAMSGHSQRCVQLATTWRM